MAGHNHTGIIGLGSMGFGMAESLLRAGHVVWCADIDDARVAKFHAQGGQTEALSDVASQLDALVCVVLNAEQTNEVLFGTNGLVRRMAPGAVVIGCATVAPDFAKEMAERCDGFGVCYLDAPISGGASKAATGELSIMASGAPEAFAKAGPALDAMAETVFNLGNEAGAGSAMKATNQLLAGVHIAAMAEAMTFGISQGIDPNVFLQVIPKCAGTSWMLENRAPHIVEGDYAPRSALNIWPKDLGIVLEAAERAGFDAPIAVTALKQYGKAVAMGLGTIDDASVAKVYAEQAGLSLPAEPEK